jgi:hypothetical protein
LTRAGTDQNKLKQKELTMRLMTIGFMTALGMALIVPVAGYATDGSEAPARVSEPASPPPGEQRVADAPEQIGHSARQFGDSVETRAKTFGYAVRDGARHFGRSVVDGWRSFRHSLAGE